MADWDRDLPVFALGGLVVLASVWLPTWALCLVAVFAMGAAYDTGRSRGRAEIRGERVGTGER
jgi:hypothetical protein